MNQKQREKGPQRELMDATDGLPATDESPRILPCPGPRCEELLSASADSPKTAVRGNELVSEEKNLCVSSHLHSHVSGLKKRP